MAGPLPLHKQFHPEAAPADASSSAAVEQAESVVSYGAVGASARPAGAGEKLRRALRVGDLAKRTGKTVRALHLYEELGLLVPADRTGGGYRLYNAESELRVRWIDKLQQMGFSLTDIRQIVADVEHSPSAPEAMTRLKDLFREKLADTREELRKLKALESELSASLRYLETCDTCNTEELIRACAACVRHDCEHKTPDLVAGFRVQ